MRKNKENVYMLLKELQTLLPTAKYEQRTLRFSRKEEHLYYSSDTLKEIVG